MERERERETGARKARIHSELVLLCERITRFVRSQKKALDLLEVQVLYSASEVADHAVRQIPLSGEGLLQMVQDAGGKGGADWLRDIDVTASSETSPLPEAAQKEKEGRRCVGSAGNQGSSGSRPLGPFSAKTESPRSRSYSKTRRQSSLPSAPPMETQPSSKPLSSSTTPSPRPSKAPASRFIRTLQSTKQTNSATASDESSATSSSPASKSTTRQQYLPGFFSKQESSSEGSMMEETPSPALSVPPQQTQAASAANQTPGSGGKTGFCPSKKQSRGGGVTNAAVNQFVNTNTKYGTKHHIAIDQKTNRRLGPEERLFFSMSAWELPLNQTDTGASAFDTTLAIYMCMPYRVLGTVMTNAGNRRNASR